MDEFSNRISQNEVMENSEQIENWYKLMYEEDEPNEKDTVEEHLHEVVVDIAEMKDLVKRFNSNTTESQEAGFNVATFWAKLSPTDKQILNKEIIKNFERWGFLQSKEFVQKNLHESTELALLGSDVRDKPLIIPAPITISDLMKRTPSSILEKHKQQKIRPDIQQKLNIYNDTTQHPNARPVLKQEQAAYLKQLLSLNNSETETALLQFLSTLINERDKEWEQCLNTRDLQWEQFVQRREKVLESSVQSWLGSVNTEMPELNQLSITDKSKPRLNIEPAKTEI